VDIFIVEGSVLAGLFTFRKGQSAGSEVDVLALGEPVLDQAVGGWVLAVVSCSHFVASVEEVMDEGAEICESNMLPFLHGFIGSKRTNRLSR
jgi:hypothetical protein